MCTLTCVCWCVHSVCVSVYWCVCICHCFLYLRLLSIIAYLAGSQSQVFHDKSTVYPLVPRVSQLAPVPAGLSSDRSKSRIRTKWNVFREKVICLFFLSFFQKAIPPFTKLRVWACILSVNRTR